MRVKDLMTPDPVYCTPDAPLQQVADLMVRADCGEIPICRQERIVGVVTDRDIACRTVAEGRNPLLLTAADIMTRAVVTAQGDEPLEKAISQMELHRVMRLPVVDKDQRLIGMLSTSDIASYSEQKGGEVLRNVSEPSLWKSKMRVAL